MPVNFLTEVERLRFNSVPADLTPEEIIVYFTLSNGDHAAIPATTTPANCLGFALQLVLLRYLGFHLADLSVVPQADIKYVAAQLGVQPAEIKFYGERVATRAAHQRAVEDYLGFRHPSEVDLNALAEWLTERALEHDRPLVLLQMLCERLLGEKFVRPGLSVVERMAAAARAAAEENIFQVFIPFLDEIKRQAFDGLLIAPAQGRPSPIVWLRESATSNNPKTILSALAKLRTLQQWQVGEWDLSALNPNRRKQLAQIGFRSTNQALQRMSKQRRYPIILAFLYQLHEEVLDELVELFDRNLYQIGRRAERKVEELEREIARLSGDKIKLLKSVVKVLLDKDVSDAEVRQAIYQFLPEEKLRLAYEECEKIGAPLDTNYFAIIANRYSYLRRFVPEFLACLPLNGNQESAELLEAVKILKSLDERGRGGKRRIPADAPRSFISNDWWTHVFDDNDRIDRKFYELSTLFELRESLRSGDVWVEGSRRYNRIESYLIPSEVWEADKNNVCRLLALPENGAVHLKRKQVELEELFLSFDDLFDKLEAGGKLQSAKNVAGARTEENINFAEEINVRLDSGKLVVTRLVAEDVPESSRALADLVAERLPDVELTDLLIEVDRWTAFSQHFTHPNGNEPRSREALAHCYASILAQACNFGLTQMSRMSGLSYSKLHWHTRWYLSRDTLKSAVVEIVNEQHRQPLAKLWGSGTLSSSDGQRFPVPVKTRNAVALPKYFGYGRGLTNYTWTSDQYSQYGTKIVSSTIRDATYVLDEILDNETELTILEHTTDTAGYTDLVFALFDLLGMQFSPRLADLPAQKLYAIDKTKQYRNINSLIKGKINVDLILRNWDDLLRVAGSLKQGYVTASLLIGKFQSFKKQNAILRAMQEYGQLNKTIFILKYLQSPEYQRRTARQLNKGETLHSLRNCLFVANERQIRKRRQEEQLHQALCLNLITNAVVLWNTVYLEAVLEQLKREGYEFSEEDVKHLSPAGSEHINVYGRYYFNIEENLKRKGLRELRKPEREIWGDLRKSAA